MITVNVTEAEADFHNLIDNALDEPIRITSEKCNVILISEEKWESILEIIHTPTKEDL